MKIWTLKGKIFFVQFNSFYPKIYLLSEMQREDLEINKLSLISKFFDKKCIKMSDSWYWYSEPRLVGVRFP